MLLSGVGWGLGEEVKDLPWCLAVMGRVGWDWGRSSGPVLCLTGENGGMGVSEDCPRLLCVSLLGSVRCALEPALFTFCFVFLALPPPASYPLPVFVSLPRLLLLCLARMTHLG